MLRSLLRCPLIFGLVLLTACAGADAPVAPVIPVPPPAAEPLPPGTLMLSVSGLPEGTKADIAVTGTGFARSAIGSVTWSDLKAGRYQVAVRTARGVTGAFAADTTSFVADVISGGPPAAVVVAYRALPSALNVQLNGVPGGAEAPVRAVSPSGDTVSVPASKTFTDSVQGIWRVFADTLAFGGVRYAPSPAAVDAAVLHGDTATATLDFSVASGALALSFTGLPNGVSAESRVDGPNGYVQQLNGTATLIELAPGAYRVVTSAVVVGGVHYRPSPDTLLRSVSASLVAEPVVVHYQAQVGQLVIGTVGLPAGAAVGITVTGATGAHMVTSDTTLRALPAGAYTINASPLTIDAVRYVPKTASSSVMLKTGESISLTVEYVIIRTVVDVVITGLPSGAFGSAVLTSPANVDTALAGTARINPAAAGRWQLLVTDVTHNGSTWKPIQASFDGTVSPGDTLRFFVAYAQSTGALSLTITGLPTGVPAQLNLSGPDNFATSIAASKSFTGLTPGEYYVSANDVTSGGSTFIPKPRTFKMNVMVSDTAKATVVYTASGPNYAIEQVHVTQATQRFDGAIPLVANRDALLRVFVTANGTNSAKPDVRVRVYDGATLLSTTVIAAPEASVRQSAAPAVLTSSWNVAVPAHHMRPGLRVLAELDPQSLLKEADRSDNVWPSNGSPRAIVAYNVPAFRVRLIPVVIGATSGNVSSANANAFLHSARLMFPLNTISADVRAPFTSSATELQANDGNGDWLRVLNEINALRATDSAPGTTHYYGVVATSYNSGVAGYGYLPGRAAIGWDKMPSGDGVAAHEWGHNFGVFHAPCGTGGDPRYPYPNADIGQVGWNAMTNTLVQPNAKDLMSYCSNNWISDFTWTSVMDYRGTSAAQASNVAAASSSRAPTDALLVWGRIVNGRITLEPAFRVRAPLSPIVPGTHRVELLDDTGLRLSDVGVEATRVDHVDDRDERHFAVVLPFSDALAERLSSIRVRDVRSPVLSVTRASAVRAQLSAQEGAQRAAPGASQQARAAAASAVIDPLAQVSAMSARATRVSWSNRAYNMAMLRDAQSGEIMGFVRRSGDAVITNGRAVEVVFSDGVRSVVRR